MGGALLAVEQAVDQVVLDRDALANRRRGLDEQGFGHAGRLARKRDQLHPGVAAASFVQHGRSPCGPGRELEMR